jgi:hypothetical protein
LRFFLLRSDFSGDRCRRLFSGRSTMRCRIPSSCATDEMVSNKNMDPGWRTILFWKVMSIELSWISDTPPTWRASCRCFGSNNAPRVAPRGAFWSRTVLPTVARWFVPDARETVDNFVQVWAALRRVIPYILAWILCVVGYKGILKDVRELSRWLSSQRYF